jgi:hypothetical protein
MYNGEEVTGRRGRRRRKLLDDLKGRRRYSHLKKGALDLTMWRARYGRGFGPVVRQTTKRMNDNSESVQIVTNVLCCIARSHKFYCQLY